MKHIPREHGSTVMVLCGALAGWLWQPALVPEVAAMLGVIVSAFLIREPLGLLLKRPPAPEATRRSLLRFSLSWGLFGLVLGLFLLVRLPWRDLLWLGAIGGPLFALLVFARATRRERTAWAEAMGVATLALPPVAIRLATVGTIDPPALVIAGACLLFFTGATLHLRAIVRERKMKRSEEPAPASRAWLFSVATAGVGLLLYLGDLVPLQVAAANAVALLRPVVMRGWVTAEVMRVGLTETGLTLAFLALLILA